MFPASSVVAAVALLLPRQGRSQTPYCEAMRAETRPDRRASTAAVGRVVLAGACWALAAVLAKYAFQRGVPPVRLAEGRVAIAVVCLAPVLAWRRPDLLRPPAGTWPALAAFGASVAAVNLTYYVAIDHLPVGVAIALQYTGPAMLLAATALLLRGVEPAPGRLAWVAAGLTLAGAVLASRAWRAWAASTCPGWPPGWPRRCCSPPTCSRPSWPAARAPSRRPRCCGGSWSRWPSGRWPRPGGRGRCTPWPTRGWPRPWSGSAWSAPCCRSPWP